MDGFEIRTWWRRLWPFMSADEFIRTRPQENKIMLAQKMGAIAGSFVSIDEATAKLHPAAHAELKRLLERWDCFREREGGHGAQDPARPAGEMPFSWDDAFRCEQLLVHLIPATSVRSEFVVQLDELRGLAPKLHDALAAEWTKTEVPAAEEGGQKTLDIGLARSLLLQTMQAVQWRTTQRYLIRKLGVLYASRVVQVFGISIVIALAFVLWELYGGDGEVVGAEFSGFALGLAAGLLGASFSALTRRREITAMDNLEEIRTAIGVPMILLRLGVGVGAAAILYFLFESGLVEGLLFPDLNAIGFGEVAEQAVAGGEEGARLGLGRAVPNAELSKLVVWSFLAGFSEMLVPTILARIPQTPESGATR